MFACYTAGSQRIRNFGIIQSYDRAFYCIKGDDTLFQKFLIVLQPVIFQFPKVRSIFRYTLYTRSTLDINNDILKAIWTVNLFITCNL